MRPAGVLRALLFLAVAAPCGATEAALVSSLREVAPGGSFDAGLSLRLPSGWHSYWVNPGDSGLATGLRWTLPPGWEAGPLLWPAPARMSAGGLEAFGYEGPVVLPVRLKAPAGAKPKTTHMLRGVASWLECREVCVPGRAELRLRIGIAERSVPDGPGEAVLAPWLARVPRPDDAALIGATRTAGGVTLRLLGRHPLADFMPADPAAFSNAKPIVTVTPAGTELRLAPAADAPPAAEAHGVLLRPGSTPVSVRVPVALEGAFSKALLFGLAGGLLLNLMPCVFPILSIKVLSLVQRAGGQGARRHAIAYAAGVMTCYQALALVLLAARAGGAALGWGFQLQSRPVVSALAALFLVLGLDLLGTLSLGTGFMRWAGAREARAGLAGSFGDGIFAVIVAAPCTAPFMGAALGWALTRPVSEALAVFAALGSGTAAPYALLASWPALLSRLPRPGPWMESLKKLLSVPMFATAAWLLFVFVRLSAPAAAWPSPSGVWAPWSPEAVASARAEGRTVFVDYTAAWCLTCQVNETGVLSLPEVRAALAAPGVTALRADWTGRDPAIAASLAALGRAGVPAYAVYPKGGPAVLLPEILTPRSVLEALGSRAPR